MKKTLSKIKEVKLSYKIIALISALICLIGISKTVITHVFPFEVFLFSQTVAARNINSREDIMQITFHTVDRGRFDDEVSPFRMILDNIFIAAHRITEDERSKIEFTVGARHNPQILVNGIIYSDNTLTYLYIPRFFDFPIYNKREKGEERESLSFDVELAAPYISLLRESLGDHLSRSGTAFITTRDRGYENEYAMVNFSLSLSGYDFSNLILSLVQHLRDDKELQVALHTFMVDTFGDVVEEALFMDAFEEVILLVEDVATDVNFFNRLFIQYQIDDWFRIRGMHVELHFDNLVILYDMNVVGINNTHVPESVPITEGVSFSSITEEDLVEMLERFLF